jgi:hypothetical protein
VDLKDFKTPSFVNIVEYLDELGLGPILKSEDVTADTLLNSVAQLSAETDLSGYKDTLQTVLSILRQLLDDSFENPEITSVNVEGQDKDLYAVEVSCPTSTIVGAANLPEGIANLLIGDVNVPVNVRLTNCNTDYAAVVVDIKAEGIQNKVDFTTAKDIVTKNENSVVVVLNDIDSITVNGKTFVDLNGNAVQTLNANAAVTVFDSTLSSEQAGTIVTVNGQENVTLTAGTYADDVSSMLPDGYVQVDKVVSNRFYRLVKDADENITIELSADFLDVQDAVAWKKIAMEMAVDVALNAYTWAGVTVSGVEKYDIYEIEILDAIAAYKAGLGQLASNLVEEINCDGIEAFANDLIDKLTDFTALQNAIETDTAIVEYNLITKPWNVVLEKAANADYLTANIIAGEVTERTITIKVAGEEQDKKDLAALCEELALIFGDTIDIELFLDDLTYDASKGLTLAGLTYEVGADISATADLSKKDYVAVIGTIMAYGMNDSDAMVAAINKYFTEGVTTDLVALIENMTAAQMIASFKKANGVPFTEMITELGINDEDGKLAELQSIYEDALNICYKLINVLKISGGSQKLVSLKTDEFGTYNVTKESWHRMNLDLTLILADEVLHIHTPGTPVKENRVGASCTAPGSYEEVVYCEVCHEELSRETKTIAQLPHNLKKVEKVPATTESTGTKEHWVCNVCGKLFADAEGKNEVKAEDLVIPKLEVPAEAPIISVPTVDSENIYRSEVDVNNKLIYIDVNWAGIDQTTFKAALKFNFENVQDVAKDVTWSFKHSDSANTSKLICTGDEVTVTAINTKQKDPVGVTETYTIIVMGDTNADGRATVSDAKQVNDSVVGLTVLDEYSILAGNLNKSTEQIITVSDVGLIQLKFVDEKQYLDILKNY